MNYANFITTLRLILAAIFTTVGSLDRIIPYAWVIASLLFLLASVSDWLDGYIARKMHTVTNLGKILDPLVDKVLVLTALVLFVEKNLVPAWIAIVMLSREFLVTGIRVVAMSKGSVLSATPIGKHKTLSQFIAIILGLMLLVLEELDYAQLAIFAHVISETLIWIFFWAMFLTLVSGMKYFFEVMKLFSTQ